MAQQPGPAFEAATAPFQCSISTRAGCDCVSHVLQALCELDENAIVTSIDGLALTTPLSRRAMIAGLERVPGGSAASLVFVCSIQSLPHICGKMRKAWCTQSTIEKEEQGDPLMPLLFSLG